MNRISFATAAIIVIAAIPSSVALAQGSTVARVAPKAPRHAVPRTNFTGGFAFGTMPGVVQLDRRHRHHRGRHGNRFDFEPWGYGYGDGDGYVATIPMSSEPGFFNNGGSVSFDGDRPVYDYDRSYPYEHYQGRATAPRTMARNASHCELREVPDEGSRRAVTVTVRVCRRG